MKILIIIFLGIVGLTLLGRSLALSVPAKVQEGPSAEYLELRKKALQGHFSEIGIQNETVDGPWCVVMEIYVGPPQVIVTVVSYIDGNASIYLSPGGGYIGGIGKPKINAAAVAFVKAGAPFESSMDPAEEFSLPNAGETVFYLRNGDRIVRATAPTKALDTNQHRLSELWFAGQEVITQYRLDSEGQ